MPSSRNCFLPSAASIPGAVSPVCEPWRARAGGALEIGWLDKGQQTDNAKREREGEGEREGERESGLENYLRENTKAPKDGRRTRTGGLTRGRDGGGGGRGRHRCLQVEALKDGQSQRRTTGERVVGLTPTPHPPSQLHLSRNAISICIYFYSQRG